jgi:hypothetical protein
VYFIEAAGCCCSGASSSAEENFRETEACEGSSHTGDQTSEHEKALAKTLKQSKKFKSQSSGLDITMKASSMKGVIRPITSIKISGGKALSTSAGGGGVSQAPVRALDLFASSASHEENILLEARRKRSRKSPPLNDILKPSDASAARRTSM